MYKNIFFIIVILSMSFKSHSEIVFTDKFNTNTNWKMITDQVMGVFLKVNLIIKK